MLVSRSQRSRLLCAPATQEPAMAADMLEMVKDWVAVAGLGFDVQGVGREGQP